MPATLNPATLPGLQLALHLVLIEYRQAINGGGALDIMRARHISGAVTALRAIIRDINPDADLMMQDCGIEKAPSLSTLDRAHLSRIRPKYRAPRAPSPGDLSDLMIPRL